MKPHKRFLKNERGFTLIEMAIVLVIIGLILGAVIKGKDVINSAKQKNFYASFVKSWELAIASYYDRTGNLLGDGPTNGGTATANGVFDTISGANFGAANGVDAALKAVGLTVPASNTANSGQYAYGGQPITLTLQSLGSAIDGGPGRNTLYFTNMSADLARGLDMLIDGTLDATAGTFRRYQDNQGAEWPAPTTVVNATYTISVP